MGLLSEVRKSFELNKYLKRIDKYDLYSILLLITLYIIQGIPMGIHYTIPILLNNRIGYSKIAILSLANLPFSIKLLWAPFMDFFYLDKFGRRKTWIIPAQFLCGFLLFYGGYSGRMDRWIYPELAQKVGEGIKIYEIFVFFLTMYFLLATQDIAVDGWALSMLRPELRVHASSCNCLGQAIGANLAFFLILNVKYFHQKISNGPSKTPGTSGMFSDFGSIVMDSHVLVSRFMLIFGLLILVVTVVLMFKSEADINGKPNLQDLIELTDNIDSNDMIEFNFKGRSSSDILAKGDVELGVKPKGVYRIRDIYGVFRRLLSLKAVRMLVFMLLTKYIFFAPEQSIDLKLLSYGIKQDVYSYSKSLTIFIDLIFPIVISYYIVLYNINDILYYSLMVRFGTLIISTGFLWATKYYYGRYEEANLVKFLYFVGLTFILCTRSAAKMFNDVTDVAFFAKVADPEIGGIYMTMLNTFSNLGTLYPNYISLMLLDVLTFARYKIDGIFVECLICIVCGFWLIPKYKIIFDTLNIYERDDWTMKLYT